MNINTPQNKQILSQAAWDSMYPKAAYTKKSEHAKTHSLHYLLSLNQSDNTIIPYIKKTTVSILTRADTKNANLTPFLIATMKGRFKVFEVLFKTCKEEGKALAKQKDAYGWTLLHHARISSKEIYELLSSLGADLSATTSLNGTPEDVRALVDHNVKSLSIQRTFYQSNSEKAILVSEMGKEKMLELIGIKEYRSSPFYPEEELETLWKLPGAENFLKDPYKKYLNNPPLLTIQPCNELKGRVKHALELCAGQDLKPGMIISEYSGTVIKGFFAQTFQKSFLPEIADKAEYTYKTIDAKEIGNASRFVNWGWPNTILQEIHDKGSPRQVMIVCNPKGIAKGKPILFDYGITYTSLAFGAQKLLGREKMRKFFAKYDLKTHIEMCKKEEAAVPSCPTVSDAIKVETLIACLQFPLNVPAALLDLHFSGIIAAKEWMSLWIEGVDFIEKWGVPVLATRVQSLIFRTMELETNLSKHPELKKTFSEWILEKIEHFSVMQLLKAMEKLSLFCQEVKDPFSPEVVWSKLKADFEKQLPLYDWTKDQNAPIGKKRHTEDQVAFHKRMIGQRRETKEGLLLAIAKGLKFWSAYPNKEEYDNYLDLLSLAEGLGIKEELFELYKLLP